MRSAWQPGAAPNCSKANRILQRLYPFVVAQLGLMRLLLIWLIAKIPAMVVPATVVPATRLDSLDSEIARLQSLLRKKTREAAVLRAVSNSASGGLHAASDPASDGRRELQPFSPPEEQTTLSYTPEYKPTGGGDVESAPEMCALHNLMYCFGNDFYLARGKVCLLYTSPSPRDRG